MRFEYYDHDTSAWWKVYDGDDCLYVVECLFVSKIINVLLWDDSCYVAFDITAIANDLPGELIEELKYTLATNKWRMK